MAQSIFQDQAFYHETIRRLIISFGQLFQNMQLQKYDATGQKQQVIQIPCEYGPKNKWLNLIKERPDYNQGVETVLPRMSYEITDYRYDASRKIGAKGSYTVGTLGDARAKLFNPVPWDVYINLYSMCKDQNTSLQILEQILPYFAPSLTVSIEILPEFKLRKDIPIVLSGVNVEDSYEGSPEDQRVVIQTFTFVAQLDLFGPVNPRHAIIKHAQANVGTNFEMNVTDTTYKADVNPETANKTDTYIVDESWLSNF